MMKMQAFTQSIEENIKIIKDILCNNTTIVYREFENNNTDSIKFCLIYDSTMCSPEIISSDIIKPILSSKKVSLKEDKGLCKILTDNILIASDYKITSELYSAIDSILEGNAVLLVENSTEAIVVNAKGYSKRDITEPTTNQAVKGPKESFTEDLETNISLLRRRLPDKNFRICLKRMGAITRTEIAICYIDGLVSPKIVDEVMKRLDKVNIDGVLESNYIDELITDAPISMFKTIGSTERPDSVAAKLLEGRLAIICSGTPFVLTIPFLFIEYFQNSEDYYATSTFGTINRLIRILAFISTVSIPAVYLAVLNYHQEMIPTNLAISISVARQGVPFPTFFEIILFLFIFEILREASARIPGTMGQTVGIVGALVIGQAAVMARLISAPLVILVSFTGITGLLNIDLKGAAIAMRLILILSAMVLGLYGYIFALCGLAFYLISLRSFGVPYMLDSYLINGEDIKDTVIRVPWSFMKYRPQIIGKMRPARQHTLKNRKK